VKPQKKGTFWEDRDNNSLKEQPESRSLGRPNQILAERKTLKQENENKCC